jgi:hypothetical protein
MLLTPIPGEANRTTEAATAHGSFTNTEVRASVGMTGRKPTLFSKATTRSVQTDSI